MLAIGILGGTFDPVHNGHITIATTCLKLLNLKEVRLLPCKIPVLKPAAHANNQQRLDMLALAIKDHPDCHIDERELNRSTPSYMVETLQSFRDEFPDTPLCLILGMDAFNELDKWHQWEKLITLAHFIVISRPSMDFPSSGPVRALLEQHQVTDLAELNTKAAGNIFLCDMPLIDISSTTLRGDIRSGASNLDPDVFDYIQEHHLYR